MAAREGDTLLCFNFFSRGKFVRFEPCGVIRISVQIVDGHIDFVFVLC